MAVWPDVVELKALLDVTDDVWDPHLTDLLTTAISKVKADVGNWDEDTDTPTAEHRMAALRAAILMRPNANEGLAKLKEDNVYQGLIFGKRRRFGIA